VFASETAFRTCTADDTLGGGEGGAIRLSGGSLRVSDCSADGNAAAATGGFAHMDGANWSFIAFFPTNQVANNGGVVWSTATNPAPITGTITGGEWSSNTANTGGSAVSASTYQGAFDLTVSLTAFLDNPGPSVIALSSPSTEVLTAEMTGASFADNEGLALDLTFAPGDGVTLTSCAFGAEDGVDDVAVGGDRFRWSGWVDTSCVSDGCYDF
jgi:hypothetical protein